MESSSLPSDRLTSHHFIAAEDIVTDQTSPLGKNRRGRVFKGFWNDSLVSVKVLSDEASVDVSRFRLFVMK
jgi:hypothetical protein